MKRRGFLGLAAATVATPVAAVLPEVRPEPKALPDLNKDYAVFYDLGTGAFTVEPVRKWATPEESLGK